MSKKLGLLITLFLVTVAASREAATSIFSTDRTENRPQRIEEISCPNAIESFRQTVSWYRGQNSVLIEAPQACGSKRGNAFELTNVTVTFRSKNGIVTRFAAQNGTLHVRKNQLLLTDLKPTDKRACWGALPLLLLNLKSGELRSPGMRTLLNTKTPLSCPVKNGNV